MSLTYPYGIVAATDVDAAPIQGNFDAIKTYVDTLGAGAEDSTWRPVLAVGAGNFIADSVAGCYVWRYGGTGPALSTVLTAQVSGSVQAVTTYLDDADYTLSGETPTLRVRGQLYTNATDPGTSTWTFGLHEVTACAGAADVTSFTINATPVTGSTAVQGDAAASTPYSAVGSAFSFPSDGHYTLGVTTSATLANNALVAVSAQLQVKVT